jgi:hypothetical protein
MNNIPQAKKEQLINYIEDGYDVPFGTFTWAQWQQMQVETLQRFTQFQRAIERKEPDEAARIAFKMQEMGVAWLKEACSWIGEVK